MSDQETVFKVNGSRDFCFLVCRNAINSNSLGEIYFNNHRPTITEDSREKGKIAARWTIPFPPREKRAELELFAISDAVTEIKLRNFTVVSSVWYLISFGLLDMAELDHQGLQEKIKTRCEFPVSMLRDNFLQEDRYDMGRALEDMARWNDAAVFFHEVPATDSNHQNALYKCALCWEKSGKIDTAREVYERAAREIKNDAELQALAEEKARSLGSG